MKSTLLFMTFKFFGDFIVVFHPFVIDEGFEVGVYFIDIQFWIFNIVVGWKDAVEIKFESNSCRSSRTSGRSTSCHPS